MIQVLAIPVLWACFAVVAFAAKTTLDKAFSYPAYYEERRKFTRKYFLVAGIAAVMFIVNVFLTVVVLARLR